MASVTLTYKTTEQTVATLNVTNATRYIIQSQPSGSHFTISGKKLLMKARTPVGTYSHITIQAANSSGTYVGSLDYTVVVNKATNPITFNDSTWSTSFSTQQQSKALNIQDEEGSLTCSIVSQKAGSTGVSYFTLSGSTLHIAANTPPDTYTVVIKAIAGGNSNYNSKSVEATVRVTVSKATNPLTYVATQSYSKTFSTSAQTQATTAATGAQGTLSYSIYSQKNSSGTAVSYFSLSTTTLTVAANTPAGTYTVETGAKAAGNTNYDSATKYSTITFTINKANISPTITMANWAYGGTASTPSVSGNSGSGTVTYKYKLKSAADSAYTTTKPSDAGTYTIQASIAATTNYNAATVTKDFSITFTATPAAYSAQYNAAAHSASIKTSAPAVVVSYGTSTSYGYSVTCTNANTNYAMSSVTRTNTGTTTVYYSATKNGYTVTGSTTIAISDNTSMTLTATAYSAQYDGSAHSASIKSNLASTTINYGTSTSYGNSVTAGTSNVAMSAVTRTAVGTTTVYFQGTKTYYSSKTGSTTIKITPKFSAQSKSVTYNPSSDQNVAITAATGGTGYGYTKVSGSFSISGTNIVVPKNTAAGSYTIVVRATDTATSVYTDATYTITVNKATPTLSVTGATLNYTGSAQTLVSSSSVTGGGTIHYGLGSSSTSAPSSWSTTKPTATNVGTYYIWAKSDASANYNAVSQVYKASATIKPVMWLKFHANGGTIADSPHKYSDTQYFKLNNSIVQGCSTASGTFTDITYTINTSTTYLNVWNIASYNITRPGYSYSGTTAFNTAANGTGINVNQDNTAAGDTNPITTKRLNGGTEITANVTKTLYIKWSANTYTITLNANGGSGGSTSVQITYGTAKGSYPSITKPTRTGYTFNGFYSATSGGTQWYDANGNSVREFNLTANTTWYAQWTINSYTLTINPNGGSWGGTTASSTATQNYATTKSIAAPTRTGYTFVGWAETGVGHLSKINQTDPAFDSSSGGVAVYNNSGGDTVTHTRQSSSAGAAYGSYEILIKASSGTTSPGNGGFYQPTTSAANQKYIHVFVAKIPTGYTVQHAQNATGDGRTITWLTSRKGTGAYQIYAYQHNCGSSGTFSTFGHVYLDTGSRPVSWQLAYSAMTNITNGFADTYTYGAGAGRLTALWAPIVPVHVNVNGTWKTGPVWLNINGTWKQALEGYVNVNGTWKQIK